MKIPQQKQFKKYRLFFSWLGALLYYSSLSADAINHMSHSSQQCIHNLQEQAQCGAQPANTRITWHFTPFKESNSDSLQIVLSHCWWSWHSDLPIFCSSEAGKCMLLERSFKVTREGGNLRSLRLLDGSQNIWDGGYCSTCRSTIWLATRQSCSGHTRL